MNSAKAIYSGVFWFLSILIYGLYFFALWQKILPKFVSDWNELLFLPVTIAIHFIAAMACKMAGVSKEETQIEIFQRLRPDEPRVVAPTITSPQSISKFQRIFLLLVGAAFCIGFSIATFAWLRNLFGDFTYEGHWIGPIGLLLFGSATTILYFSDKLSLNTLTDENGVHGITMPFDRDANGQKLHPFQHIIVLWRDIYRVEIITKRRPTGEIKSVTAVFKNLSGKTILKAPSLEMYPEELREQFLDAVKLKANLV